MDDPDPSNPWTLSEIYEVMDTKQEKDPNTWNMWVMLAGSYRSKGSAGFMFDMKQRRGCVLFMDHSWFKGLEEGNPSAMRKYLHTLVHETGHTFNLPHTFEDTRPDSTSFMNYDWRYDARNGPGSYFSQFYFTFDTEEILHLRHGSSNWVEPGKSSWGTPELHKVTIPPADDDDVTTKKLKLDLFPVKESYKQTEIVSVEIRLKNISKRPLYVDPSLGLESNNVRICITKPNGNITMADPIKYHLKPSNGRMLYAAGSKEGSDRSTTVINLFYGSNGFYFNGPGTYRLRASYMHGEYYITSEDVEVKVEDLGDAEVVEQYMTDETGLYVTLGGSNARRFSKVKEYVENLYKDDKHKDWVESAYVATANKKVTASRDNVERAGNSIRIKAESREAEFIARTQDRMERFKNGLKRRGEAVQYRALCFSRAKILLGTNKEDQAKQEMEDMFKVMGANKVKETTVEYYRKKLERMFEADKGKDEEAMKPVYEAYQSRTNEILSWQPEDDSDEEDNENEMTGLGHKLVMSPFNPDHLQLSGQLIELIMGKADETDDIVTVLEYVDSLQKSMEFNASVVQCAFEIVITHHELFRRNQIRVPEDTNPSTYDKSTFAGERPFGEDQMTYFRNDSEYCYHHRHWHNVYRARGIPGQNAGNVHRDRQGELFFYMHLQMLARYDAERFSWGLGPVEPYNFEEREMDGCDLGDDFHNDRENRRVVPRPPGQRWNWSQKRQFTVWKDALLRDANRGRLLGENGLDIRLYSRQEDPRDGPMNWFGLVVEATTSAFSERYGSFHNSGHGVFGNIGQSSRSWNRSYMNTTANAVRDPIFYRWHKHVDDVMFRLADNLGNELARDPPPVRIGQDDIIISKSPHPPSRQDFKNDVINTRLDDPQRRFETGKLSHDEFFYHIMLRRNGRSSGELALTLRIFICPEHVVDDKRKWIEMDKFRYIMKGSEEIVTRKDKHSSVIRRFPRDARDDPEERVARTVSGFCECGWPYHMLLPRGTREGMKFRLCLVVTDNNLDTDEPIRSGCGSLSYCGARDRRYPDKRVMGYPFSLPIYITGRPTRISDALNIMDNIAHSTFIIQNWDTRFGDPKPPPVGEEPPEPEPEPEPVTTVCWTASRQVGRHVSIKTFMQFKKIGRFQTHFPCFPCTLKSVSHGSYFLEQITPTCPALLIIFQYFFKSYFFNSKYNTIFPCFFLFLVDKFSSLFQYSNFAVLKNFPDFSSILGTFP